MTVESRAAIPGAGGFQVAINNPPFPEGPTRLRMLRCGAPLPGGCFVAGFATLLQAPHPGTQTTSTSFPSAAALRTEWLRIHDQLSHALTELR